MQITSDPPFQAEKRRLLREPKRRSWALRQPVRLRHTSTAAAEARGLDNPVSPAPV